MSAKPLSKTQILNWVIAETYKEGHSPQAIADALGISKQTVIAKLVRDGCYQVDRYEAKFKQPETGF